VGRPFCLYRRVIHVQMGTKGGAMTDSTKGVLAMFIACCVWGLSPLYYAQLKHVPPVEVLSYRCMWSLIFFVLILLVQRRLYLVWQALRSGRNVLVILMAGLMISINWFLYIFAIANGQALESSLGYYIFPLVAVVLGRVVFAERLSRMQGAAVAMAAVAVLTLAVGLGVPPWIALILAGTFGMYGLIKKKLDVGPVVSVTGEVLLLSPLAIGWIYLRGTGGELGHAWDTQALLAFSGPLTATPLILFSYAARRARLSTLGLVQYVNPTLQFACAVFVFGEPFTPWHGIAFPLIWLALALYSLSVLRQDRAARKASVSADTSSTTVT